MVVAAHAGVPVAAYGGAVGVTVFFTLSGYLITKLCLAEIDVSGRWDLRQFYLRRTARLIPALVIMLLSAVILATLYSRNPGDVALRALAPLFYVANLVRAAGVTIAPFDVTWSLAVEEQFYLLWPPLLFVLAKAGSRRALALTAWCGAFVASVWHLVATPLMGVRWGYFLPDANAFSLALGCALAATTRIRHVRGMFSPPLIGLVVLSSAPALYGPARDGPLVPTVQLAAALLTVPIIAALSHVRVVWLEQGPIHYMGTVSYGWYLWHFTLISLTVLPWIPNPWRDPATAMLGLLAAAASWHWVERPLLERVRSRRREVVPSPLAGALTRTS